MGHYLLKDSPKTGTGDLLVSVQAIEPICIPIPDISISNIISNLIDKQIDNNFLLIDYKINQMIYSLYKLNEEEAYFISKII